MSRLFFLVFVLILKTGICQVPNFDILSKDVKSLKIRTITKFHESNKFPNGEKIFKCEFDTNGLLISTEAYEYPMGPQNPITMKRDYVYNNQGKNVAIMSIAPGGSTAIDSLIYDEQGRLIRKVRYQNGQVVQTKEYSTSTNPKNKKRTFDQRGNLIEETSSDSTYTQYKYDAQNNLIEEIEFENEKEYKRTSYLYNENGQLITMKIYLLYISKDIKPLQYYFEYETFN